jgi:hypothetical protein
MGGLNDLPNEVLYQIADQLGDKSSESEWMFTNKRLFKLQLSRIYKNTSLDLNISNKKLDSILSSTFKPGQYVKSLVFTSFTAPATSLDELDLDVDILNTLMLHTPEVKEITFETSENMTVNDWNYFTGVLTSNQSWKLSSVPKAASNACSAYYYLCAFHMRNTLTKLNLTQGMIGKNYSYLGEFKALQELVVDKNVIKSTNDLDSLLHYLPHLTELRIDCRPSNMYVSIENSEEDLSDACGTSISYLKKVTLAHYAPSNDEELLYMMKRFRGLDGLKLFQFNHKEVSWTKDVISATTLRSFFTFIQRTNEYKIEFSSSGNEIKFLNIFQQEAIKANDQKSHLRVKIVPRGYVYNLGSDFLIRLGKNSSECLIDVTYGRKRNGEAQTSKVLNVLSRICGNFEQVTLVIGTGADEIGKYLNAVFGRLDTNLEHLIISGGKLQRTLIDTNKRTQEPILFQVEDTIIFPAGLKVLMNCLGDLASLTFKACHFQNDSGTSSNSNINIYIPETNVGDLILEGNDSGDSIFDKNISSTALISLCTEEKNIQKYYLSVASDSVPQQLNKRKYDALKDVVDPNKAAVITVLAKSIKRFTFSTKGNYPHFVYVTL